MLEHFELFPSLGNDTKSLMRRIGVVCDVQHASKKMWGWLPPSKTDGRPTTLEHGIDVAMHGNLCSPEARVAVYDYIASIMPLDTDIEALSTDGRRTAMGTITEIAKADEVIYRQRLARVTP